MRGGGCCSDSSLRVLVGLTSLRTEQKHMGRINVESGNLQLGARFIRSERGRDGGREVGEGRERGGGRAGERWTSLMGEAASQTHYKL